jgi:UDP-GlcNAc:undecaprenyl-phosphate/decaprenyl-phosphate GlcNAc-1-phosphate transferase
MLVGALTILLIPVTDTLYAIIRRTLKKQPFYVPDKDHIHHMLLHLGFKTGTILLILYSYAAVLTTVVIYWFIADNLLSNIFIIIIWMFNITALFILAAIHRKNKQE